MMFRKRFFFISGLLSASLLIGCLLPLMFVKSPAIPKAQAADGSFVTSFLNEITNQAGRVGSASLLTETNIAHALKEGHVRNIRFFDAPGMRDFYASRNHEPIWLRGATRVKSDVDDVIFLMQDSWKHGLNPEKYNINMLWGLYNSEPKMSRYELELLLSDAVIRYARDLTGMRIDPGRIRQKSKFWQQPKRGIDILEYITSASYRNHALEKLAPRGELYTSLQRKLVELVTVSQPDIHPVQLPGGILRPGNSHRAIKDVRVRLGLYAESDPDPVHASYDKYIYDDTLFGAVQDFQKAHGLHPDGVIGPQTVQIMNMTREDKINQIIANLERMRWVEQNRPDKYVLVNIPSATLWAVEDGETALEMPVIVGREKRETVSFRTEITGIRFNPTWTVPPTIKREDYLPKLQEDPHYLTKRGIEMITPEGTIDPETINWAEITWPEMNGIRMVQASGSANPLGRIRLIMPNPYNIYLHDTNNKKLFNRANRTLSSGCIRMAEPEKLAMFLMQGRESWSQDRMQAIFETGRLREVATPQPVPVYILYQTVWLDEDGGIVFGPDVYGRDRKLIRVLKTQNAIHIPKPEDI